MKELFPKIQNLEGMEERLNRLLEISTSFDKRIQQNQNEFAKVLEKLKALESLNNGLELLKERVDQVHGRVSEMDNIWFFF